MEKLNELRKYKMTPKQKDNCGNIEGCLKVFISWQWGIVLMSSFIGILFISAFSRGVETTNMKRDILEVKASISVIQQMDYKLDSLLKKAK